MKNNFYRFFFITSLCLCYVLQTSAQKKPTLINKSLTKPELGIVYIGVDNVIRLFGEIPGKYIRMERSGGPLQLRPGTALQTVLKYSEKGTDTLRVYDDEKLIIEKVYEIRTLGTYAVSLKGVRDTVVSTEELMQAKTLEMYMLREFYKPSLKVSYFTVTLFAPNGKAVQKVNVEGNSVFDFIQLHKEKIQSGCSLTFSSIRYASKDGGPGNLEPYRLKIK